MRNQVLWCVAGMLVMTCPMANGKSATKGASYPITPVPFTSVKLTDAFWGRRLEASRDVTIPLAFSKCEETGRYLNFIKAAHPSAEQEFKGLGFDDTDVYKTIEGASYLLQTYPNKTLAGYIDSVLTIVAAAQEPDGYLFTARTMNPGRVHRYNGKARWEKVEAASHEFYNLGHMLEGAVAHYQATGKRTFLDIAIKYADCVEREIGDAPGRQVKVPGHQIAEMGLAKLYLVTGDRKYLDLAKFFLDKRGYTARRDAYSQSHKPVLEQDEAVGHAVRATYMYSGMADVAALTGDTIYIHAIDRIWNNMVGKKTYLTGGIGAIARHEGFGGNYELPNETAYCETCAAIGNVYLNHRLFLLHGDAKYYDVLERTLYNGLIAGVSMDGGSFFYPNPLASSGDYSRKPWFGCACCPSNICRFIPSVPSYIYAVKDRDIYVNLYMGNVSELPVGNKKVVLEQSTDYPYSGAIALTVRKGSGSYALKLRIPGWVRNEVMPLNLYQYADSLHPQYTVTLNGQQVVGTLEKGYLTIDRRWKNGDVVRIRFEMPVRTVKADDRVLADKGRIAIERGPLVYCAEGADNRMNIQSVIFNVNQPFTIAYDSAVLGGLPVIKTAVQTLGYDKSHRLTIGDKELKMIPYFAWAHRGAGQMAVWMPASVQALSPMSSSTKHWDNNGYFNNN